MTGEAGKALAVGAAMFGKPEPPRNFLVDDPTAPLYLHARRRTIVAFGWKSIARKASIASLLLSTPAFAAPLTFDCDVPPDHYSSVSQDWTGPAVISGTIKLVQMRSGNALPVAGVLLVSASGTNSVGFQLVADSINARNFDIILNVKRGKSPTRTPLGQVGTTDLIPFNLSVSGTGKATLSIGTKTFDADFLPLSAGNAMAFCSTAQFKFTDLAFSSGDTNDRARR